MNTLDACMVIINTLRAEMAQMVRRVAALTNKLKVVQHALSEANERADKAENALDALEVRRASLNAKLEEAFASAETSDRLRSVELHEAAIARNQAEESLAKRERTLKVIVDALRLDGRSPVMEERLVRLSDDKIEAIFTLRAAFGWGLAEAKDRVNEILKQEQN